jgi:Fungal Zn(2)-Cys(6) binuclear cluster domain
MTSPAASASVSGASSRRPSNLAKKPRAACNRCHSQKLRCGKKLGEATCERCLKLGTLCRFEPRAPRASRASSKAEHAPNIAQDDLLEPLSALASVQMTETHSVEPNINMDASEWLFPRYAEASITEGRGQSCYSWYIPNLTCLA